VVLIGGWDKTVPANLMGAASAGVPAISLVTGSMLTGGYRGERMVPAPTAGPSGASTAAGTLAGSNLTRSIPELDASGPGFPQKIVRPLSDPIYHQGGIAVLRGNLAPAAIIKQAAASPQLLEHSGRAVVFDGTADLAARIDYDDLDVDAADILVLKNIGPVGAPGMPAAGYIPILKKLVAQGVRDMVRISDGRMSGTAARHSCPARNSGVRSRRLGNGSGPRLPEALRHRAHPGRRRVRLPVPAERGAPRSAGRICLNGPTRSVDEFLPEPEFFFRIPAWEPPRP
jgi:dihydroxyacid dehydratase/phosphogluconate dehydratase